MQLNYSQSYCFSKSGAVIYPREPLLESQSLESDGIGVRKENPVEQLVLMHVFGLIHYVLMLILQLSESPTTLFNSSIITTTNNQNLLSID